MGMDEQMLSCIRALAESRIQDAKNESRTKYHKKLLENGSINLFELAIF